MISNLVGIPLPIETDLPKDTFVDTEYWRLLFGLMFAFSVIQSALLLTVFNYETPKFLKQNGGNKDIGSGRLFITCGGITAGTALFVIFIVKETKGLTEYQVANLYSRDPDVKIERASLL